MNILLVNHYAGSPEMGMEFRPWYMAREWIKLGHNVLIITASFAHVRNIQFKVKEKYQEKNIGGITEIRGISELIKALKYTEVKLDLAGEITPDYKKIIIKIEGWQNVNELGFINREKSGQIKKESIAGMVTFLPVPNHINSQPNKIFEYMASKIPVIGSNFPLWKEIIEDNNCGLCVNPLNSHEISKAINYLAKNPAEAKEMGSNGKKLVLEKYNWEIEEKKLFDFYKKILEQ